MKKYMYIYILKALLKSTVADQSFLGREDTSVSMSKGGHHADWGGKGL